MFRAVFRIRTILLLIRIHPQVIIRIQEANLMWTRFETLVKSRSWYWYPFKKQNMSASFYPFSPLFLTKVMSKIGFERDTPARFQFRFSTLWIGLGLNMNRFRFYYFSRAPTFFDQRRLSSCG